LYEGDHFEPWDTVLTIEGPYECFAHLETLYLGVLCRRTRICTNTRQLVEAARPKPVLFFGARQDFWGAQPGDGYAAHAGGASSVSTDAQGSLFGARGVGTVPHALIAAYDGDTVRATKAFVAHAGEVDIVALVDYGNDCVRTSLEVARAMEGRLWGVRLDTSENLVDRSVIPQMGTFRPTGVNPQLVWNVRNALDAEGFGEVKIVVSGGLNAARVRHFEDEKAPVDVYAVGSAIVYDGRYDFTGDVVMVNGAPQAKVGRELRPNPKLDRVK
jgi:nicotinate phosphoribosyltransferase